MKFVIFACLWVVALAFYTDVDEKLNIQEVLNNSTEMHAYADCYLDKGPCTDSMLSYKKHFYEAIDNACSQCSPAQKHIAEAFIKVMLVKYPNDLNDIKNKYDPQGIHFQRLLSELAKY